MPEVRRAAGKDLHADELAALRTMVWSAFEGDPEPFTEDDWEHALGGMHFILEEGGVIAAHASVVERELHVADQPLATGYVEAVATRPELQRQGHGSTVMREVRGYLDDTFELGALDTGVTAFYEGLGWEVWQGPTYVRTESGLVRTADDDGNVMVRLTPSSPEVDLSASISCEWRKGDVW